MALEHTTNRIHVHAPGEHRQPSFFAVPDFPNGNPWGAAACTDELPCETLALLSTLNRRPLSICGLVQAV